MTFAPKFAPHSDQLWAISIFQPFTFLWRILQMQWPQGSGAIKAIKVGWSAHWSFVTYGDSLNLKLIQISRKAPPPPTRDMIQDWSGHVTEISWDIFSHVSKHISRTIECDKSFYAYDASVNTFDVSLNIIWLL